MKIVLSAVLAVFLIGCSSEKGSQESSQQSVVSQTQTKSVAQTAAQPVVKSVAKPVAEPVVVQKEKPKAVVEQKVKKTVTKVTKAVTKAETAAPSIATAPSGAKIFVVCSSCHGAHAEKKALGKSQIIKGWSVEKITTALQGYKAGTYGGTMKAVMKGQASKLSDQDIQAVAKYISHL